MVQKRRGIDLIAMFSVLYDVWFVVPLGTLRSNLRTIQLVYTELSEIHFYWASKISWLIPIRTRIDYYG